MAVGMIVDPQQAEAVIASGEADLVALGHAALRDPHFPLHAQQQASHVDWNVQAGWWLDHRQNKLQQLGPWVP
jgi:2,4-dienoyl-CoA reductase-like NADH-dependent reductase (Old Yellow Enzyme family)